MKSLEIISGYGIINKFCDALKLFNMKNRMIKCGYQDKVYDSPGVTINTCAVKINSPVLIYWEKPTPQS